MKLYISFDGKAEEQSDRFVSGDLLLSWKERSIYTYSLNQDFRFKDSLGSYIQANKTVIREKTLQLLNDVATIEVGTSSLVDYLAIDDYFSLFWPCPVGEKCNIEKSPWLDQLILLSTIYTIAHQECVKEVATLNASLHNRALINQLFNRDLVCTSHWQVNQKLPNSFLVSLCALSLKAGGVCFQLVVRPFAAIIWALRFYYSTLGLRNENSHQVTDRPTSRKEEKIVFIDYYCYLQRVDAETACPIYWGQLLHYLNRQAVSFELLHHYVPYVSPSVEVCSASAQQLIESLPSCSRQLFFESILSPLVLLQALCAWSKSLLKLPQVAVALLRSSQPAAHLAFKSYIQWHAGTSCLKSLLYYYLYTNIFNRFYLDRGSVKVVFLQENLDLEYCLLAVLRKHNNIEAFGYPHSIVRFWDLRFFHLPSECFPNHSICHARYLPDRILTNGSVNRQQLTSFYNYSLLFSNVEATRYEALGHPRTDEDKATDHFRQQLCSILLVSGPQPLATSELLKATITAVSILQRSYPKHQFDIGVKLHPQCRLMLDPNQYPGLPIHIETKSISSVAHSYDLAVLDSNTSAVVDTLYSQLPSVNYLSGRLVDLSPSSSLASVESASDITTLASCIRRLYYRTNHCPKPEIFFFSQQYNNWLTLLSS